MIQSLCYEYFRFRRFLLLCQLFLKFIPIVRILFRNKYPNSILGFLAKFLLQPRTFRQNSMRLYDIVFCQLHELLIGDFLSIQQNQLTTIPYSAFFLSIHIKKGIYIIRLYNRP